MAANEEKVQYAAEPGAEPDGDKNPSTEIAAEPSDVSRPLIAAAEAEAVGLMFRMASAYQRTGDIHQAIGLYKEIMVEFPDLPEAQEARYRLLEIGREHEKQGKWRSALFLYKRVAEEN